MWTAPTVRAVTLLAIALVALAIRGPYSDKLPIAYRNGELEDSINTDKLRLNAPLVVVGTVENVRTLAYTFPRPIDSPGCLSLIKVKIHVESVFRGSVAKPDLDFYTYDYACIDSYVRKGRFIFFLNAENGVWRSIEDLQNGAPQYGAISIRNGRRLNFQPSANWAESIFKYGLTPGENGMRERLLVEYRLGRNELVVQGLRKLLSEPEPVHSEVCQELNNIYFGLGDCVPEGSAWDTWMRDQTNILSPTRSELRDQLRMWIISPHRSLHRRGCALYRQYFPGEKADCEP